MDKSNPKIIPRPIYFLLEVGPVVKIGVSRFKVKLLVGLGNGTTELIDLGKARNLHEPRTYGRHYEAVRAARVFYTKAKKDGHKVALSKDCHMKCGSKMNDDIVLGYGHVDRYKETDHPVTVHRRVPSPMYSLDCSALRCKKKQHAYGYCGKHYWRIKRRGDVNHIRMKKDGKTPYFSRDAK
tara:strand:- start:134 stop:679 length:546 start_codon:yes stop_codon:yes gene_type:complete